jgi:hypothetical protein
MRFRSVLVAMLVAALPLGATAAAGAQEADANVTVVHGVPELEVDVYVNGDAAIEGFAFGDVAGPLALPAGDYLLEIRPAGAAPESEAVLSGEATLAGGDDATVVAHLTEAGDPTLGVFVNPTEPTMDGEGRVVVRHTAAAPAVDILADGAPLAEGLANPDEAIAEVPAATYAVEVVPSGADEAVLAADLPVTEGVTTIVYAIGSAADGSLTLALQSIDTPAEMAEASPAEPIEEAELADEGGSILPWILIGGLVLVVVVFVAARARRGSQV